MTPLLKSHLFPFTVFITGACVLVVEVVAVRALSPYFGNTIFTFSSVISVILAALSVGYYLGGSFADRHPRTDWFFGLILTSGLLVVAFHFLSTIFLPTLSTNFSLVSGPPVASLILFFIPAFLLGTLSPYAVKLQTVYTPEIGVGSVAGRIFFWSTLGSITGSLSAGFILIPQFGIDNIFIGTGIALFLLGSVPLFLLGVKKSRLVLALFALIILVATAAGAAQEPRVAGDVVYSADGLYEKITIYDGIYAGRPARFFQQDRSGSGAMFLDTADPTDLAYEYTQYYALHHVFTPRVENALVIGGGAYSIPKALLVELPEAEIDVVEIEPSLYKLAQEYFDTPENPRLHNYVEDGRRFLQDSEKQYDFIFGDAYSSLYSVPTHLTTREFLELVEARLTDGGAFVVNIIGDLSRQEPSLIFSEIQTFQSVFPNTYAFAVRSPLRIEPQNIILVGHKSDEPVDFDSSEFRYHSNPVIQTLRETSIKLDRFDLSQYPVLTDNHAPVEYLTSEVLRRLIEGRPTYDGEEMLSTIAQQLGYGPRYLSAPGHERMQEFLIAEMEQDTDEVHVQRWSHVGEDGEEYELANVIGLINPDLSNRIILATHYDSKRYADKDTKQTGNSVPGANDSASGVAVLVELARSLGQVSDAINVGVDFVFFDGEEGEEAIRSDYTNWQPLGSTYFAENLNEIYGARRPSAAIVLDMVCDADLEILKEASSVRDAPALVEAFWASAQAVDGSAFVDEAGETIRDDHTPLNAAGIPSILVIDFDYPHFHTTQDTLDKCSAESLATVLETLFKYIAVQ